MRGQPHLIVSRDPLKPGENYRAVCGKEIEKAVWVWQVVERGEVVDRLKTCPKCWGKLSVEDVTEYVYGAVSQMDAQPEHEEVA